MWQRKLIPALATPDHHSVNTFSFCLVEFLKYLIKA